MRLTEEVWAFLMEGDAAVRWQVLRAVAAEAEAKRELRGLASAGWCRDLLARQATDGSWGGGLYSPKWTSTTYTLLLLRMLGLEDNAAARTGALLLLDRGLHTDGGINFWPRLHRVSETCVTGMVLSIASRFAPDDRRLDRIAENLLNEQMPDGGWNCRRWQGATHASLHTTISVLEGLLEYESTGCVYTRTTREARGRAHEFLLVHRMYRSHRTGRVIDTKMKRFAFPPHWHYDILRGLDYLQAAGASPDTRARDAVEFVAARQGKDGCWRLPAPWQGRYHFRLEEPGQASRWNTLRALRVLAWWEQAPLSAATHPGVRARSHHP